jgi:serine/threonine protein phosphatase PrpC/LysM repeat protein
MENLVKISSSAASHTGMIQTVNEDNFYINGRSMHEYEADCVQVSVENSGREYLFAVSAGMDREIPNKSTSISAVREIRKLHQSIKSSSKNIEIKFELLSECIEETNNLLHSVLIGNGDDGYKRPAFAGLLISESRAAVLNSGSSRVYMVRDGSFKQLTTDDKKTERLLKMGIITREQAEILSSRFGIPAEQEKTGIEKRELIDIKRGDMFLLCSNGLSDIVDDERIFEILIENMDTGYISNALIKEALKKGGKDNITALVLRVEKVWGEEGAKAKATQGIFTHKKVAGQPNKLPKSRRKKIRLIKRIVSTTIALLIIIGVIYGLYKLWTDIANKDSSKEVLQPSKTTQTDNTGEEGSELSDENSQSDGEALEPENGVDLEDPENTVTYTVKSGDNLYKISQKYYGDPEKYTLIMNANNIEDANLIHVGQVLVIPDADFIEP